MTEAHDIVPGGFDLSAARHAKTTTPEGQQPRCPECGSINISHKTGHHVGAAHRRDGEWRCNNGGCKAHFEEPVWGEGE